jgi:hypothetical protein
MNLDIISNVSVGIGVVKYIIILFFYSLFFYLGRRPSVITQGTQDRLIR